MYKTVRHGENSLQYTILPQTEEVLTNSGVKGIGRDYSPSMHAKKSRKRSVFPYLLFFAIGILITLVIAAAPVFARIKFSDDNRKDTVSVRQTSKVFVVLDQDTPNNVKLIKLPNANDLTTDGATTDIASNKIVIDYFKTEKTTVQAINEREKETTFKTFAYEPTTDKSPTEWMLPALKRLQSSTTLKPTTVIDLRTVDTTEVVTSFHQRASNTDLMLEPPEVPWRAFDADDIIRPTATQASLAHSILYKRVMQAVSTAHEPTNIIPLPSSRKPKVLEDVLITTKDKAVVTEQTATQWNRDYLDSQTFKELKEQILDMDDEEEFKESIAKKEDLTDDVKKEPKVTWTSWPVGDRFNQLMSNNGNYQTARVYILVGFMCLALFALFYHIRERRKEAMERQKLDVNQQTEVSTKLLTTEAQSEDE